MNAQVSNTSQMRPMQQADIEVVDAIEQRAYEFPWTAGIFRDCLKSGHQAWVLDCRAGIIGYGVLSCAAGEAHLLNICIAPEHQGHGHCGGLSTSHAGIWSIAYIWKCVRRIRTRSPCTKMKVSTKSADGRITTRRRKVARMPSSWRWKFCRRRRGDS